MSQPNKHTPDEFENCTDQIQIGCRSDINDFSCKRDCLAFINSIVLKFHKCAHHTILPDKFENGMDQIKNGRCSYINRFISMITEKVTWRREPAASPVMLPSRVRTPRSCVEYLLFCICIIRGCTHYCAICRAILYIIKHIASCYCAHCAASTKRSVNTGSMLAHRLRRWPNIVSTLPELLV